MFNLDVKNQKILINNESIELWIKREDEIHPFISGNKYRKVKYNIDEAKRQNLDTLLTFGGAFSNHILAVAVTGKELGLKTIGIIRGNELENNFNTNPTLSFAYSCGMQFKFVSRDAYREKTSEEFINSLELEFGEFYLLPEGGTNTLAVKGCEEILRLEDKYFDYICSAVGTGGTISGLINSSISHQKVFGFPALKGDFLNNEIKKYTSKTNWQLITDYHFGGYAKVNSDLVSFVQEFNKKHNIPLDLIYTGKMLYGIFDLLNNSEQLNNKTIIAIHTGGLQGNKGFEERLGIVL